MKTTLIKKCTVIVAFVMFSTNITAQMPADPGDDPISSNEPAKPSETIITPDESRADASSDEEQKLSSQVVLPATTASNSKNKEKEKKSRKKFSKKITSEQNKNN